MFTVIHLGRLDFLAWTSVGQILSMFMITLCLGSGYESNYRVLLIGIMFAVPH